MISVKYHSSNPFFSWRHPRPRFRGRRHESCDLTAVSRMAGCGCPGRVHRRAGRVDCPSMGIHTQAGMSAESAVTGSRGGCGRKPVCWWPDRGDSGGGEPGVTAGTRVGSSDMRRLCCLYPRWSHSSSRR